MRTIFCYKIEFYFTFTGKHNSKLRVQLFTAQKSGAETVAYTSRLLLKPVTIQSQL